LKSKITSLYIQHSCDRIHQGDILKNIQIPFIISLDKPDSKLFLFDFVIILSQECDLENSVKKTKDDQDIERINVNQYLPNVLIAPGFLKEKIISGEHLLKYFKIKQGKLYKNRLEEIKKNTKEIRYHYLQNYPDFNIPELIIDFKIHFTLPLGYIVSLHKKAYLGTLNELYREQLSQRYSYYISRIGLPEIEINNNG